MPNQDSAFGLSPIRNGIGAPWDASMAMPYYIATTYGSNLFIGDPVIVTGDANANEVQGRQAGSLQAVEIATAGATNYISGVIVGFEPMWSNLELQYWAASETIERICYVCDDPHAVFIAQEDSVGGALAVTAAGNNVNLVAGTGSTTTGLSAWELDSSSVNTTNDIQIRLLRVHDHPNNVAADTNAIWECMINLHSIRNLTGVA